MMGRNVNHPLCSAKPYGDEIKFSAQAIADPAIGQNFLVCSYSGRKLDLAANGIVTLAVLDLPIGEEIDTTDELGNATTIWRRQRETFDVDKVIGPGSLDMYRGDLHREIEDVDISEILKRIATRKTK